MPKTVHRVKLTKRCVEALKTRTRDYFTWDSEIPGFGVRVLASGKRSYLVQYRNKGGRSRRYTIGLHGPVTAEKARETALLLVGSIKHGKDPAEERSRELNALTVSELCDEYLNACEAGHVMTRAGYSKKPSTLEIDRGRIERHIKPLIGRRKLYDVSRTDIERFMQNVIDGETAVDVKTKPRGRAIVEGGRGTATRTVGLLGGIFTFAVARGYRPDNPVRGIKRPADNKRQRILSTEEYGQLGAALLKLEKKNATAALAARLLTLTGARRGEILALEWAHVDISGRCLRLPDTKTGASVRPLGMAATKVLQNLKKDDKVKFVFPSTQGEGHYVGLPKAFSETCAEAKLEGATLHTLRHSFASVANELGFTMPTIAAMIGHSVGSITGRYIHHLDRALIAAADSVSKRIVDMLDGVDLQKGEVHALKTPVSA
jgi:integrase